MFNPAKIYWIPIHTMIYLTGTGFNLVSQHFILCEANLFKFHAILYYPVFLATQNDKLTFGLWMFLAVVCLIFNQKFEARLYDEYSWALSNTADWADIIPSPTAQ